MTLSPIELVERAATRPGNVLHDVLVEQQQIDAAEKAEAAADLVERQGELVAARDAARITFEKARDSRHKLLLKYAKETLPDYLAADAAYRATQRASRSLGCDPEEKAALDIVTMSLSGDYQLRRDVDSIATALRAGC